MTAQELADLLGELLTCEACDPELSELPEDADVWVSTYREAGVLTSDAGLELTIDGKRYQLTVVEV